MGKGTSTPMPGTERVVMGWNEGSMPSMNKQGQNGGHKTVGTMPKATDGMAKGNDATHKSMPARKISPRKA